MNDYLITLELTLDSVIFSPWALYFVLHDILAMDIQNPPELCPHWGPDLKPTFLNLIPDHKYLAFPSHLQGFLPSSLLHFPFNQRFQSNKYGMMLKFDSKAIKEDSWTHTRRSDAHQISPLGNNIFLLSSGCSSSCHIRDLENTFSKNNGFLYVSEYYFFFIFLFSTFFLFSLLDSLLTHFCLT